MSARDCSMGFREVHIVSDQPCSGFFCDVGRVAGLVFLAIMILGLLAYISFRLMPVNRVRRKAGMPVLRWSEIARSRMSRDELGHAQGELLDEERELQRQLEWEKEQAAHELIRTGQHIQRQWCSTHDRWCFHAFEEGHPSGGFDNPQVPDGWPPDLRKRLPTDN